MSKSKLEQVQNGPHGLANMDQELGYNQSSSSQHEDTRDLSQEFRGVQKVILMKRLGSRFDKILVITGYDFSHDMHTHNVDIDFFFLIFQVLS